jgi:AcrR family transcriptional regulator
MSIPYELEGRTSQKQRTRDALVSAAQDLVRQGMTPTVEETAETASISRTTAYRYFPNQRALLVAAYPETDTQTMLPDGIGDDPRARLDAVITAFTKTVVDAEPQHRTMLRLSLDPDRSEPLLLRQGRAIRWIEEALAPCRAQMSEAKLRRLVLAIRSATGIEALVWLTDIAVLSRPEAVELMRWSARALLDSALAEASGSR